METTIRQEAVAGSRSEAVEVQAPTRRRLIPAIAAALNYVVHPRSRDRVETDAVPGRSRRPERAPDAARSPMEAGITGGFSLLMGDQGSRRTR